MKKLSIPALLVLTLVGACFTFVIVYIFNFSSNLNKDLNEYTKNTEATILEYSVETHSNKNGKYYIHNMTLEYEIDGKVYKTKSSYSSSNSSEGKINDKITVYYKPNNLEHVIPKFAMDNMKKDKPYTLLGVLIVSALLALFALYKGLTIRNKYWEKI